MSSVPVFKSIGFKRVKGCTDDTNRTTRERERDRERGRRYLLIETDLKYRRKSTIHPNWPGSRLSDVIRQVGKWNQPTNKPIKKESSFSCCTTDNVSLLVVVVVVAADDAQLRSTIYQVVHNLAVLTRQAPIQLLERTIEYFIEKTCTFSVSI